MFKMLNQKCKVYSNYLRVELQVVADVWVVVHQAQPFLKSCLYFWQVLLLRCLFEVLHEGKKGETKSVEAQWSLLCRCLSECVHEVGDFIGAEVADKFMHLWLILFLNEFAKFSFEVGLSFVLKTLARLRKVGSDRVDDAADSGSQIVGFRNQHV